MLGTYPLALCGVFIYGAGYTLLALAVLAVGGVALVVICVLSYRFLVQRTELEQDKLIHRLQRVGVRSADFMPTLQELFATVDAEGNNSISIDSVRKFMRPALKHCSAADYSFVMTKASSASSTEISFEALRDAIEVRTSRDASPLIFTTKDPWLNPKNYFMLVFAWCCC